MICGNVSASKCNLMIIARFMIVTHFANVDVRATHAATRILDHSSGQLLKFPRRLPRSIVRLATCALCNLLLLGHTKLESTVRYLGIEVDDALNIAEQIEL